MLAVGIPKERDGHDRRAITSEIDGDERYDQGGRGKMVMAPRRTKFTTFLLSAALLQLGRHTPEQFIYQHNHLQRRGASAVLL